MKYYLSIFLLFFAVHFFCQQGIYLQGTTISIPFGDSMYVNGDVVNDADANNTTVNSRILNTGAIYLTGDIVNNSNGNLFWNDSSGVVVFNGSATQNLTGPRLNFYSIETNNASGIILQDSIVVQDTISLISGSIDLNGNNLHLQDSIGNGYLFGENNTNYIFGATGEIVCRERSLNPGGNIAGLGLEFDPANTLGQSELRRGHVSISNVGDGSINRYYSVRPSFGDTVNVKLNYLDSEIGGLDESDFQIFESIDSTFWRQSNGVISSGLNQVTSASIVFDALNILSIAESNCDNPPLINFIADTLYSCSGDSVRIDPQLSSDYQFRWNNLATDSVIYAQSAGNYVVRVVDNSGCFSIDSVRVLNAVSPTASATINPAIVTCMGTPTQFDGSTSSGGVVNYIWDYLNDNSITDTTQIASSSHIYVVGGDFTARLTVETNEGCLDSATVTVQIDSLPSLGFSFLNVCADSSVSFTNASQGQGVYNAVSSVFWDFGNGNTSNLGTPPAQLYNTDGNYTVKLIITEDSQCKDSLSQTITVHPNPLASFSHNTICEGEATVFNNASTNINTATNYNWAFGDANVSSTPNPSHIYANDGSYTATLLATSSFGCTNAISNTVEVQKKPITAFTFSDVCQYDMVVFNNSTTDAIAPIYDWTFGDATSSSLSAPSKNYATSGNYPVQLKVTSNNGCTDSLIQTVSIFDVPVSQFTIADNCADSLISLTNTSSIGTGTITNYFWNFGGGQTDSNPLPSMNYSADGSYIPSLLVTSNNGCTDISTQNITIHPNPVFSFLDTVTTCGTSLTLDAGNTGSIYLWTTTEVNQTITVSSDGDYGVEVITPFGCRDEDSLHVLLNVLINPSLGNDTTVCDSIVLDAYSPSSNYVWSTMQTDSAITVFNSGMYIVDRVDQNLCTGKDTINVIVNASPVVNLGMDQEICDENNVIFDAGNPSLDILWSTTEITQTITADTTGTYSVLVTDLATGCFDEDSVLLTVNPLPIVNLGNDSIVCDSLILYPGLYNSVLWSTTSVNDSLVVTITGQYWVDATNSFGCVASDSINITVFNSPDLDLGTDTVLCQNEILNLIGASNGNHTWSDATTLNSFLVSSPGTIYVDVVDGICMATDTINVAYDSIWNIDLGLDTATCVGLDVDLIPNYTSGLSLDWYQGTNFLQSGSPFRVSQSGIYHVQATNSYGCVSTDTIQFTSYPFPVASEFLMASDAAPGDTVQFVPVTIDSNLTYFWSFGTGATSTDNLAAYRYVLIGDYDVTLVVSNGFCTDNLVKVISISPTKDGFGFDPNAYVNSQSTILDAAVYPNPSNGSFNLSLLLSEEKWVEAYFTTLRGKVLYNERLGNEIEQNYNFDFGRSLSNGVYILTLRSGIESKVIKVVVNN